MKNSKTLYIVLVLLLACASCQKDKDVVNMKATINNYGGAGSKVYVDGQHYANWNDQDQVWINGVNYTVSLSSQNIATISGVAVSDNDYYAVYPADRISSTPSGFPTLLMPQVQLYRQDNAGNQLINAPMAAYCASNVTTHSLLFTNLCSLVEVNLPDEYEVAYINVSSSDYFLWGEAAISGTSTPQLTMDDATTSSRYTTSNHTVTLDCTTNGSNGSDNNNGTTAASGVTSAGPFYVVVPARTYRDLTVDVYVYTATANGRRTVKLFTREANQTSANIQSNNIYAVQYTGEPTPVQPPYPGLGTGEFSVSPTKKVRIARGNLQYQASTGLWRFAPEQWEIVGNAAGNTVADPTRATQSDWIDLFGFATSNQGSPSYAPTMYSNDTYGPSGDINLTSYDWGVNEISNGGNQPNKWRTLTKDEWQYLFRLNSTTGTHPRDGRQGLATLTLQDGSTQIMGCILAPDDYNGISWTLPGQHHSVSWNDWLTHRSHGCIFLPCCGQRNVLNVTFGQSTNELDGYYWSSTSNGSNNAWRLRLRRTNNNSGIEVSCISETRYIGSGVRLVRDVD